jgi:hypothetical protein
LFSLLNRLYREALKQAVSCTFDRCPTAFVCTLCVFVLFVISKAVDPKTGRIDVAILTTGISAGERRLRAELAQTLKRYLKERRLTLTNGSMRRDTLFNDIRDRHDARLTRDTFDDAIRTLEEENFLQSTHHSIRFVTLGESNLD